MLPRFDRRHWLWLGACVAAQIAVVAGTAAAEPTSGAAAVVAALLLAPVAVVVVASAAARLAGGRFPAAAATVYVLLPFLANRLVLGPSRGAFDRHALPALVGTRSTWLLALGIAAAALAAALPERAAAACGGAALVASLVVWSPSRLGALQPFLHETAWSVAFPEWLLVATVAAAVLRRPLLGAAVACFAVSVILRAAHHPLDGAGFWRSLAPLAPLGGVLLSSLWLLVPRLRPAFARRPAS
ncbi:MAG TPA: hypothetical protein VE982_06515 [Gaiellaceae bacterium]|nr:hypothetical protein [Gaiellaceae bacterium]